MLIALPLAVGLVAALAWRHADGPGGRRGVLLIAALALGVRLLATLVVSVIAHQTHGTGVWLNDEASFFLATEALVPYPLDRSLPEGLDHLAGDGFLGVTTVLALAGGVTDANTFRVFNAALGAAVVVLSTLVARRQAGPRAALVTGAVLSVWPTLVLWSATMLRDTLGSLAVVALWWTLVRARELGWARVLGTTFLTLVIVLSLRPYLGGAMLAGVIGWTAYPLVRRLRPRQMALLGAGAAVLAVALVAWQARRIDYAAHELLYRQTMTRMETLGRLYTDQPPTTADLPVKPGTAVGLVEPGSGWILGGVIQDFDAPDVARVAFTDESIRSVPLRELLPLESASIPPLQMVAWIAPNLGSYLAGTSITSDPSSPVWIVAALAWDALLAAAIVGAVRLGASPREWLYPLCIVGGTVLALVAIPGAPANADRHRTTQTVPLLLVFASGLASARFRSRRASGVAVTSINSTPASEPAPASSRIRSAR